MSDLRDQRSAERGSKGWGSTLISIAALALSAATMYLTLLRQTEHVEMLVMQAPEMHFEGNRLRLAGSMRVSFVNKGNRPVAIAALSLSIDSSTETHLYEDAPWMCQTQAQIDLPGEPFVLEAGKILIKTWNVAEFKLRDFKYEGTATKSRSSLSCLDVESIASRGYVFESVWIGRYVENDLHDLEPAQYQHTPVSVVNQSVPPFEWVDTVEIWYAEAKDKISEWKDKVGAFFKGPKEEKAQ